MAVGGWVAGTGSIATADDGVRPVGAPGVCAVDGYREGTTAVGDRVVFPGALLRTAGGGTVPRLLPAMGVGVGVGGESGTVGGGSGAARNGASSSREGSGAVLAGDVVSLLPRNGGGDDGADACAGILVL